MICPMLYAIAMGQKIIDVYVVSADLVVLVVIWLYVFTEHIENTATELPSTSEVNKLCGTSVHMF